MRIDIAENEKEYVLKAELPGVDQKDIDILVRDNVLTISAKRNEEKNEQRGNYIRKERFSGTVARSFTLDGIDDSNIEASFDKGILTLTLPKHEESNPSFRRIELK
jgi:HSP20 family protein